MPFKSEKQRRYLWATQPDLAKRWAHKYPESNKGLPMYADEKKEEKSAHQPQNPVYVNNCANSILRGYSHKPELNNKAAEDATYRVKLPQSDKPTYAGQEEEEGQSPQIKDENAQIEQKNPENAINSLLQKIAIVLSRPMAQRLENRRAQRELRKPRYQPRNPGIHQYAVPSPYTPMPMGMQPQQPQQAQQPAANTQVSQPGNSPTMNPINSFGALSSAGNINGNAAFGQKNSPDSAKTASIYKQADRSDALSKLTSMETTEPEDILYYDDEYSEELGARLKAASATKATLRSVYEKWAGVANIGRNIGNQAEGQGVDPATAALVGLLGAGALYGTYYGGKKLLTPIAKRMSLRTLGDDEVGQFSMPLQDGTEHAFAERYREPGLLGGFFMNDDATNISNALLQRADKTPGFAQRLETSTWQPDDLNAVGRSLIKQYPDRYRPVASKTAEEETPPKKKPSAGAAMYIAGLQGNDAWQRAQDQVNEKARRENPGGFHDRMGPLSKKTLDLRGRSIAHQATTPGTRMLSDALGGQDSLGGMLVNALGAIGGGPEVQDKVRKMYAESDIDAYRDRVKDDAPVSARETNWHKQVQGLFADKDYAIAAHRWNRSNHPLQYWINPFDRTGPLQELNDRIMRRHLAGAAEPDTFGGRLGRSVIPFVAPFMGGEEAQDKIRATAHRSGVYGNSPAGDFGRKAAASLNI